MLKSPIDRRDAESFNYAKEINLEYGKLEQILCWCKESCSSEWRFQMVEMSAPNYKGRYLFYFDNEQDYLTFLLKCA